MTPGLYKNMKTQRNKKYSLLQYFLMLICFSRLQQSILKYLLQVIFRGNDRSVGKKLGVAIYELQIQSFTATGLVS